MSLSSHGPPGRLRPLRINTDHAGNNDHAQARLSVESAYVTPTVPSFFVSTPHENVGPLTPTSPSPAKAPSKSVNRARNESRKLLAHVLAQLQNRPRPPPVYGSYLRMGSVMELSSMGVLLETVRGVVKLKQGKKEADVQGPADDDSDDEDIGFSPETTFDLVVQLKDVLVISKAQGWQIFDDGGSSEEYGSTKRSTLRSRRSRALVSPTRSRSPSPAPHSLVNAPELLSVCISVIESIILEDCRYKMIPPRPSRPPNALQSLVLDVVQFLIHRHRNDPKIVASLGLALIPAFSTFGPEMHSRLLSFFERSVIREVLSQLSQFQDPTGSGGGPQLSRLNPNVSTIVSIYVDEVQDSTQSFGHSSFPNQDDFLKLKSTNAPHQAMAIYQLSSLIPPLVGVVLDYVDVLGQTGSSTETQYYAQRLLDLIIRTKPDAHLDLLQVVAHHTPRARYIALCLMTRYWPEVIGHVLFSKPLPVFPPSRTNRSHLHQFVPWRVTRNSTLPGVTMPRRFDCRSCMKGVTGFCLLCPWCMCTVHFDCYDYPEGNEMVQYTMTSDPSMKRVAMHRYSPLPFTGSPHRPTAGAVGHNFEPINLFTLCLCFICRTPLWGLIQQGLHCASCSRFVHHRCLEEGSQSMLQCDPNETNSDHMSISWAQLRTSCLDYYHDPLGLASEELAIRSYEELSILRSALWMQLQLITNGIALGSIIVMQRGQSAAHGKGHQIDEFELHKMIATCASLLPNRHISPPTDELLQENGIPREDHWLYYDWNNLAFITSLIKAPHSAPRRRMNASTDLLNVAQPENHEAVPDTIEHPYDTVPFSHLREALHQELGITCQASVQLLLSHLHHLGMFVMENEETPSGKEVDVRCSFILPFLLDISTDVETLVTAVESSLTDLDLTVNEVGLLLLSRRLWPDGLSSEYALRRLSRTLIFWILAEDEHLATILRGYIAKQKPLPGLRPPNDAASWPTTQNSRSAPTISVNNGGEYTSARRALLMRYVVPWLIALHDQDTHAYTIILHDICFEHAQNELAARDRLGHISREDKKKYDLELCEGALRAMTKLSNSSVTLTIFDDLFIQWLNYVSRSDLMGEAITSLSRLFSRDGETYQRSASFYDTAGSPNDSLTFAVVDPWRTINNFSMQSKNSLSRSLQWLCILASSGVEISDANLLRYPNIMTRYENPLSDALTLVRAALSSVWLRSIGRQGLQRLFGLLHAQYTPEVLESLTKEVAAESSLLFVRQSLCVCLLLYSCERTKLSELGFIQEDEIVKLPSRRKLQTRATAAADPLLMDSHLLTALQDYMTIHVDELSCLIVKFLQLFTESPLLEPHEVDNFILKNGTFLSSCAWQAYEIQRHDISSIRPSFFLRVLVVDPQPFQNLLDIYFKSNEDWERRLNAVMRLFRIVLDVTSPAFAVEDRQWRSSVVDIFYHFFASLWLDDREEIRLAARTFSSSLLPAHLDAITLCWNEVLSKAPVEDRVKLVSFLIQLHSHFPSWQVLSWGIILETLRVEEAERGTQYDPTLSPSTQSALESAEGFQQDTETLSLHVSIMTLSLQLIADGIPIDYPILLSLKSHLMRLLGLGTETNYSFYMKLREVDSVPPIAIPCLDILRHVLDSTHTIDVPSFFTGSQDGKNHKLLVGSPFLDVLFATTPVIREIFNLPVLTTKNILEGLYISVHKYDFESAPLKPLQSQLKRAVSHALYLMTQDVSYEARQVALSAAQAFIRRWNSFMGSVVYISLEASAKLIVSQGHHSQDMLISQAKRFMETTLENYSNLGLFLNLLKRPLEKDIFLVLKEIIADVNVKTSSGENLKEALLRDTISRVAESDLNSLQTVLTNLQSFIEKVYHQGYSADLMSFCGLHLTYIARRAPEYAVDAFDPSPLLQIPAILIQHNKLNSRDMLLSTDTVLRIILNRLNVNSQSIIKLLTVTTTLYRKTANDGSSPANPIAALINEILVDGLRMKARLTPLTLKALIETITSDEIIQSIDIGSMLTLADHAMHFLFLHIWQNLHSDDDFMASMAVARLVLRGAKYEPNVVNKFVNYAAEFAQRPSRQPLAIRAWNLLLLAALQDHNHDWGSAFCSHLPLFSILHHHVLRWYLQVDSPMPDTMTTDINHAYISLKLWIMVTKNGDFHAALTIWSELWPPFENLVSALDTDKLAGSNMILGPLVSSSIADLFLFLATLHTPLVLQTSSHIALLNRLKTVGRPDASSNKITRALRALADPPAEVAIDVMVNQVAKEIVAVEKVRILEAKRDMN